MTAHPPYRLLGDDIGLQSHQNINNSVDTACYLHCVSKSHERKKKKKVARSEGFNTKYFDVALGRYMCHVGIAKRAFRKFHPRRVQLKFGSIVKIDKCLIGPDILCAYMARRSSELARSIRRNVRYRIRTCLFCRLLSQRVTRRTGCPRDTWL